jgi:hypothetical protein
VEALPVEVPCVDAPTGAFSAGEARATSWEGTSRELGRSGGTTVRGLTAVCLEWQPPLPREREKGMHIRRVLLLVTVILAMVAVALPATAHDPDGDHVGPGSEGPDEHSTNVKLQSNLPPSDPSVRTSDLAFFGKYAVQGSYGGFRIIDIKAPGNPKIVSELACNGAQGDVSVHGDLLFQSVDTPQSHGGCDSENVPVTTEGKFEGVRIFDISDLSAPELIASVNTDCGSHTHTLLPDEDDDRVILYVSSYPIGGGAGAGTDCESLEQDPVEGGHSKVGIIEVPLSDPTAATVNYYELDDDTEWGTYINWTLRACHDISVFAELDLAAAACLTEAQLWDISDPLNPQFLWRYDNPAVQPANIDLFHSAAFSWDGTIVAFGDESGGGGAARCVDPEDDQGRIWFVDVATGEELGSYKIPRSEEGTCTMHNFNFVPLRDRNVLVASAYTGGTTVVDVDALLAGASEAEAEIGFYKPSGANTWSSYWYDGRIYASGARGLDTFLVSGKEVAGARKLGHVNPQTQERVIR